MIRRLMALGLLLAVGCVAEVEVAPARLAAGHERETVAFVTCKNVCYSFFGVAPICSGVPWRGEQALAVWEPQRNFWEDEATLANNMIMVRAAAREMGSARVGEIRTEMDDRSFWSLWICNRREITTTATILKDFHEEVKP